MPIPTCYFSNGIDTGDHIIKGKLIGNGNFGSVRECHYKGERYAVKSLCKCNKEVGINDVAKEIVMLQQMKHHGIVNLIHVLEDREFVHLFTELCQGGELYDRIIDRATRKSIDSLPCFSEHEASCIIRQVLDAVLYMHMNDVVHRDIKPENILFVTKDRDSQIKIIDLGLATHHFAYEPPLDEFVGTPYYVAPEVIKRSYNKSCDIWSVGVVAYILLSGCPPFDGANDTEIYNSILSGRYCVNYGRNGEKLSTLLSMTSMDFVIDLLKVDPERRTSAALALKHPWMNGGK